MPATMPRAELTLVAAFVCSCAPEAEPVRVVAVARGCTPCEHVSYDSVDHPNHAFPVHAGCVPCREGTSRRDIAVPGFPNAHGVCFPESASPDELREVTDRIYTDGWKLLDPLDARLDMSSEDPPGVGPHGA